MTNASSNGTGEAIEQRIAEIVEISEARRARGRRDPGKAQRAYDEFVTDGPAQRPSKAERRRAAAADGTEEARRDLPDGGRMTVLWGMESYERSQLPSLKGAYSAVMGQDSKVLSPGAKLVWIYLASMRPQRNVVGKEGWVRPYQKTIAGHVGLSVKSVKRHLDALEQRGWIEVRQRGERNSNLYRVLIPLWPDEVDE
jgi:DNA-binding MarR family transcriptional regulator